MTNALFSFPDENHKRQFKKLSPTSRNEIAERIFAADPSVDRPAAGAGFCEWLAAAAGLQYQTLTAC